MAGWWQVAVGLYGLLRCCGGAGAGWLVEAVAAEDCGPVVGAETKQQFVQVRPNFESS
jgi:hypothetical protein